MARRQCLSLRIMIYRMPQLREISSVANPRVKDVAKLHQGRQRRKQNLLIAQSLREVDRALDAGLRIHSLFTCDALANGGQQDVDALAETYADALPDRLDWFAVTVQVMNKLAPRENPEGMLAVFHTPAIEPADIPTGASELWLVAVGLTKPGNLGAIVRTADAAGATGVIACDSVVDVFHPSSIRSSTAAVFTLPVLTLTVDQTRSFLTDRKIKAYAASPSAEKSYDQVDLAATAAIVIGAEDTGLDGSWLADPSLNQPGQFSCEPVLIPMQSRTADSLNASVAAAVLLFEAARQRRTSGGRDE